MSVFDEILSKGKQAISVLSNPSQSSVLAAGAAGAFSAEVNNFRKQAIFNVDKYSQSLGPTYKSAVDSILRPVKTFLSGSPDNPIPEGPSGRVLGLTYLQFGLISAAAGLVSLYLVIRRGR